MENELLGVGRTWLTVWGLVLLATVLLVFKVIDVETWKWTATVALSAGAGKSTVIGTAAVRSSHKVGTNGNGQ